MAPLLPATETTFTDQEVFNAVVSHAGTMKSKSLFPRDGKPGSPFCAYRGEGENACFVGGLLTDDEARSLDAMTMNGQGGGVVSAYYGGALPDRLKPHVELLSELQPIHDDEPMDTWPVQLRTIANERGLLTDAIDKAFPGA